MGKLKHSNSLAKNKMEDKIKETPLLIFIEGSRSHQTWFGLFASDIIYKVILEKQI